MKLLSQFIISLLFLVTAEYSWSAACCGGGFAAPSLIAGDDKAQLTTSYSWTDIIVTQVDPNGFWRKSDQYQTVQTFRLEGAHIFKDRFQAGFSVPVIQKLWQQQTYSGLGDLSATLGYEYLPDWNYHPIRPKGLGFLQLTLPTGKSRVESEIGGVDSRGQGFWALGIGTLLSKNWTKWDAFFSVEAHRSFEKDFSNSQISGRLIPGYGGSLAGGVGYNLQDYRFGTAVTWTYEDAIESKTGSNTLSPGAVERYATAVASVSYLASEEWSGTFSYSDQTLMGTPANTSLGRGLVLQLQRRWGR